MPRAKRSTKRSTKQDPPPDPRPQPHVHGPAKPMARPTGLERLRKVMALSADADVDRIADDAATEIEHLRSRIPPDQLDEPVAGSDRLAV